MRILGVDDGPFRRGDGHTVLVGVLHTNFIPSGVAARIVSVDGKEATEKLVEMVREVGPDLVVVDSVTCCGFNFIDGHRVYLSTGIPVLHVYLYPLDMDAVRRALEKIRLLDERFEVIQLHWSRAVRVECRYGPLWVTAWGLHNLEALACSLQVYSRVPLVIQNAHRVARLIVRWLRRSPL
ncbi:protein of unknown function DUF99 [Pyrolobus fumarii 1A]|uniref:UPF0215 protein Pyrfu_0002 n=1 Tax=Pyrolobus fumarii (strain DSM 11204 / 1A) TaxID=694429 RepID=G0EDN7_PYRF1|nr:DUF99 family protein [Pyrolobus fumarii]AEM37874.1 protein of unknown function DUF99 [Pyrolobus fumarii 1A]